MRGNQLARQWRENPRIEASPKGLTIAEIDPSDGAQGTAQMRSPSKACSINWDGLFCFGD